MSAVAVIGGTGLDQLDGLDFVQVHSLDTPYGNPSRPIEESSIHGHQVFFLQRHGAPRAIPPHKINYRANLWALNSLGVSEVIAINAVGGISPAMETGVLVVPDQLIDYTWGREHTIDDGSSGTLQHIEFTNPYSCELRAKLARVACAHSIALHNGGTHAITQGPRLETAAEIRRLERDGCDIVGMTGMPEAALATELGLSYASICMVVNAAAGKSDIPITLAMMRETLEREAATVAQLIRYVLAEGASA